MNIYFIIAILFGIFLKLFDDIIDNPLFRAAFGSYDKIIEEFLKTGIMSLNTVLIMKEPLFGFSFVLCSIAMIISDMLFYKEEKYEHKGMDHDFWWSYALITLLVTGISFFVAENLNINVPVFTILIFLIFGIFLIEPYLMPENHSKNKIYIRSIIVILYSIFLYFSDEISVLLSTNIDYIIYLIGGTTSYFILSIIINTLYPTEIQNCVSIEENKVEI